MVEYSTATISIVGYFPPFASNENDIITADTADHQRHPQRSNHQPIDLGVIWPGCFWQ